MCISVPGIMAIVAKIAIFVGKFVGKIMKFVGMLKLWI